jgi:Txe/YoeB family toxin of Txe-Axe toxin-antitoxin module
MKLGILERHGFKITEGDVKDALLKPDQLLKGYKGRKVAQRRLDPEHVLRVVYEELNDEIRIITVYPGRRERYE